MKKVGPVEKEWNDSYKRHFGKPFKGKVDAAIKIHTDGTATIERIPKK